MADGVDNSSGTANGSAGGDLKSKADAVMSGAKTIWEQAKSKTVLSNVGAEQVAQAKGLEESLKAAAEAEKPAIQESLKKVTEEVSKLKAGEFAKLGRVERLTAAVGGNIGQASAMGKLGRIGGSAVGLGVIISGAKNLIAPERDENGERKSSTWKQVGKIAGGAALTYLSAVKGGANKAMGIS